ncbi:MAG: hypothetical protein SFY80_01725 [Verrucomicrobiota bacterium]|nr:hypothetical protein [Verrucomicrobiota bacterium]
MDSSPACQVYVILGASGSGRREVLLDLVGTLIDDDVPGSIEVLISDREDVIPQDQSLADSLRTKVYRVPFNPAGHLSLPAPGEGTGTVFIVTDGRANPVDQLEVLKGWLQEHGLELARIFTVINCQLLHAKPNLQSWYDACIHFSDVMLLNRREGVPNKWFSDFKEHCHKLFHPGVIELVKKGKVAQPELLLYPEPRRLSLYFDEMDEADILPALPDIKDLDVVVIDEAGDEHSATSIDPDDDAPEKEIYFERHSNGHRVKSIPDITAFL